MTLVSSSKDLGTEEGVEGDEDRPQNKRDEILNFEEGKHDGGGRVSDTHLRGSDVYSSLRDPLSRESSFTGKVL